MLPLLVARQRTFYGVVAARYYCCCEVGGHSCNAALKDARLAAWHGCLKVGARSGDLLTSCGIKIKLDHELLIMRVHLILTTILIFLD
jgi:hypothetical protein